MPMSTLNISLIPSWPLFSTSSVKESSAMLTASRHLSTASSSTVTTTSFLTTSTRTSRRKSSLMRATRTRRSGRASALPLWQEWASSRVTGVLTSMRRAFGTWSRLYPRMSLLREVGDRWRWRYPSRWLQENRRLIDSGG
jgi:hypothetical protein